MDRGGPGGSLAVSLKGVRTLSVAKPLPVADKMEEVRKLLFYPLGIA